MKPLDNANETYATDEKQTEQDAVCAAPPTDYEMKQAYANQASIGSCIGYQKAPTDAYSTGYQDGLGHRDYQEEQRRNTALMHAITYEKGRFSDPAQIVDAAKAFHAFLKGEA